MVLILEKPDETRLLANAELPTRFPRELFPLGRSAELLNDHNLVAGSRFLEDTHFFSPRQSPSKTIVAVVDFSVRSNISMAAIGMLYVPMEILLALAGMRDPLIADRVQVTALRTSGRLF
jgi:hypothetical protein